MRITSKSMKGFTMRNKPLYERFRPASLDDVLGQPKAVAVCRSYIERGLVGGHCFWLSGTSGSGKTTLARILADSIADPFFVTETTGRDVSARFLDVLESDSRLYSLGKGGRAWIINEAHGLSRAAIERLLDITETLPSHCTIIFTTTWDGQDTFVEAQTDAEPLLSRCVKDGLRLTNQGLAKALAPRLLEIARTEGMDGQPEAEYVKLMQRCKNNIRAALVAIESGEMLKGNER